MQKKQQPLPPPPPPQKKLGAAGLSIAVNVSMLVLKIIVAIISGSIGILAEAIHSGFDLLASGFAYWGIKKAMEPSDSTHHYGHYKFENLSSLIQSIFIAMTSVLIIYEATNRLLRGAVGVESGYGIGLMVLTVGVAHLTSKYLHEISVEESSSALEADACHFTTDVWSALSVMAGLIIVRLGMPAGDPLAAIAVALMMLHTSAHLSRKAVLVLLDTTPGDHVIDAVSAIITADKRVVSFHKFKARQSGTKIFIDVHIRLGRDIHLKKAHAIAHDLKRKIFALNEPIEEINMHIEPD